MSSTSPKHLHGTQLQAAGGEAHAVSPEARAQPQDGLTQGSDAIEQAERVGHQPGPPRGIRIRDGIEALDPVLTGFDRAGKSQE